MTRTLLDRYDRVQDTLSHLVENYNIEDDRSDDPVDGYARTFLLVLLAYSKELHFAERSGQSTYDPAQDQEATAGYAGAVEGVIHLAQHFRDAVSQSQAPNEHFLMVLDEALETFVSNQRLRTAFILTSRAAVA